MTSSRIHVVRSHGTAEPAVLVAAWLMGELLDLPGLVLEAANAEEIVLSLPQAHDAGRAQSRLTDVLTERRFTGWALSTVEGGSEPLS